VRGNEVSSKVRGRFKIDIIKVSGKGGCHERKRKKE